MHLTSTFNSVSRSDSNIPVAIFCFGDKCKFLILSKDYEETLASACDVFDIDSRFARMQTSALDVCKGRSIDIDPSVYPLIWTVLDEIEIVLDEDRGSGSGGHKGKAPQKILSPSSSPVIPPPKRMIPVMLEPPALAGPSKLPGIDQGSREPVKPSSEAEGRLESNTTNEKGINLRMAGTEGSVNTPKKFKPVGWTPTPREEVASTSPASVVVKEEKVQEPERFVLKPKEDSDNATINDEARFEITITGPQPNQIAQFKTRGAHTVKKVLMAACKTFNIKYERASLTNSVAVEDEDGEVENHVFECDPRDTIAICGITTQSKLVVRMKKAEDLGDDEFIDD